MKKSLITIYAFTSLSTLCLADSVDDLKWIAQDYKPYSYIDSNSQKTGMAFEVLDKILHKVSSSQTINNVEVRNFSRSFIRRNNDQNTVFFPLAKLSDREKYFKWVGPITLDEPVLYAKNQKILLLAKRMILKKYTIAGKDGYYAVKTLQNITDASIKLGKDDHEDMQNMKDDKVDLVVCSRLACISSMKDLGMNPADYHIVYRMQTNELSFAFNKDTDDDLVNKVSKALEELKTTKEYQEIVKRYE